VAQIKHRPQPGPLSPLTAALAGLFAVAPVAYAQDATLPPITVNERTAPAQADVTGFGDVPLRELPLSATVIGRREIEAAGARRLADITTMDASIGDAYNAPGYWDFLSVRGFTLDNRFNYRREGLPISAETTIPLDNKERIEILKGTSGIQAGTSAPGGLVNFVVKRPTDKDLREVHLEASSRASLYGAMDLGGRFGIDRAFGYRVNLAQERLRPLVRNLDGERSLAALAGDWRINRDTVLEGEIEWSHKSQASQVGFSLLGNTLPPPANPRLNLNNQSWSQPSVFDALTGTVRLSQALGADWRWSAQFGTQRLTNDDFTAFPFGCSAEGNFDRYCSDGTFDAYDFRSENEKRRLSAASLNLKGKMSTGAITHDLSFGILTSKVKNRIPASAYNFVGTGNVDGTAVLPADPTLAFPPVQRDERSVGGNGDFQTNAYEIAYLDASHGLPVVESLVPTFDDHALNVRRHRHGAWNFNDLERKIDGSLVRRRLHMQTQHLLHSRRRFEQSRKRRDDAGIHAFRLRSRDEPLIARSRVDDAVARVTVAEVCAAVKRRLANG